MGLRQFFTTLVPRFFTRPSGEPLDLDTKNREPLTIPSDAGEYVEFDAPVFLSVNVAGIVVVSGEDETTEATGFNKKTPLHYPAGYTRPERVTKVWSVADGTVATGVTAHHNYGQTVITPAE